MKKYGFLLAFSLLVVSCTTTKPLYNWSGYDSAVYSYIKAPNEKSIENLTAVYEKMINNSNGSRQVPPPGTYADYGLLMINAGNKDKAIELLKMETDLYPESKQFIDRIIKRLEE